MPASVTPIGARRGEYALLQLAPPGGVVHDVGVLLLDPGTDRLHVRLRSHWEDIAGEADAEVFAQLQDDFEAKAGEMGGERLLRHLEDSLSNVVLISARQEVAVDSFIRTADRLFERYVERTSVLPFRTHLPLYSLRAAAGRFGADEQVEEEDWVRIPEDLRATEQMFVIHVVGRSMEPRIPDGTLNVFRAPVVGSRQNKLVLVELFGQLEDSARYTVKKYTSRKNYTGEDEWAHEAICLEPLNREYEPLRLEPGDFRVIAEWVRTLD